MTTTGFWSSAAWHAYERAYGDAPGTREALLRAADWDTYVLDLAPEPDALWRGLRKSYKNLVRRKLRDVEVLGRGASRGSSAWCVSHMHEVHREQAGRETRSPETWDLMKDWLADGSALVALAPGANGGVAGYAYAVRHGLWSYYFSGATRVQNVSHALVWALALALRAGGTRAFELGWGHRAADTEKDCGIHHFKAGFGAALVPVRETLA